MEKTLKQFKAIYKYKKDGYVRIFDAYNEQHARQLAIEYQKQDNKGEPKSERLALEKVIQVAEPN